MKMEEGKDWGGAWKTGYFNSKPAFGGSMRYWRIDAPKLHNADIL